MDKDALDRTVEKRRIDFSIENPETGELILIHSIECPNALILGENYGYETCRKSYR